MRKLLTKILSVIVAVTATLGLVMLPKTAVQASEFTFGAVQGASVKYGDTVEETGLRFTIEVDKEFYASLAEGVEFGALISTANYASSKELVIGDDMVANVCYVTDETKFDLEAVSENFVYYASITYTFNDEWKADVVEKFAGSGLSEDEIFAKAKLQAMATELICRPYYKIGEEVVYAELSDARSMVKVANGAVIDGETLTDDFVAKYLSTLTEVDAYVSAEGEIEGMDGLDLEGATFTADGNASDIEFNIETYFNDKEVGNYYYVTAFKGYDVYRVKFLYATKLINEAQDLDYFRFDYANTQEVPHYNGYYVVTNDIDASSYVMASHSFASNNVYPNSNDKAGGLEGVFDGQGHVISNLSVQSNGIFGWINEGATIKNIAFTNATLLAGSYPTLFAHGLDSEIRDGVNKPTTLSDIYVQVNSMAAESGVLVNNGTSIHGTKFYNVVMDWTNFGEKELGWLNKTGGRFSTFCDYTVNAGVYKGMFNSVYTITSSPVVALRTGSNAITNITVAGNKVTLEEDGSYTTTDANLQALLDNNGYSLTAVNVQEDIKSYDTYADMAKDAEANAESLATFGDSWTVVNGVPYWKSLYEGTIELVIEDRDDNVVNPSDIVLNDAKTEYEVKLVDGSHAISGIEIVGEGLFIDGNKFRLAEEPVGEGSIEVTATAIVNGIVVTRTFTVAYSNVIALNGKVLYSALDKALDLPSLQKAGVEISSLEEIDGYVVGEETVDVLDLEVIISNYTTANKGRDRSIDTAQEVKFTVGNKLYVLSNVYAYTKLIDEAEDLKVFTLKGATEENPYNEVDGYFLVTKNIDASALELDAHTFMSGAVYPGNGYNTDVGFRGVFDGQGYVIDGLTTKSCGLFATMNAPVVKNIAFTNANIGGYYACLFAQSYVRGKDYNNDFNSLDGLFENVYVSVNSINYNGSNGSIGVFVYGTLPGTVNLENVIVDYLNVDATAQSKIEAGSQFYMIGSTTGSMASSTDRFVNCYSISTAPVLQRAAMPGFAENQVEYTLTGNKVTAVGNVLDEQVNEVLTRCDKTLTVDHVLVGLKAYDDYTAMAAANNDYSSFSSNYWAIVNGVPYWAEVYKQSFTAQVKQGDDVIEGEILVDSSNTELTLNIVDKGGNAVEGVEITAPEGVVVDGNVVKLAKQPSSVGYYEVKLTATVDGIVVEKWVTINYTNEVQIAGKVLYSALDKALDLPSLTAAGVEIESLDEITGYVVEGEEVDVLDLEVIISNDTNKNNGRDRAVDTAQTVSVVVDGKVYNIANVYAYTKLIDEAEDLKVFTMKGATEEDPYNEVNGYFLVTKNIDASALELDAHVFMSGAVYPSGDSHYRDVGFKGVLDGQGYTIDNLTTKSCGLFGTLNAAVIKNIAFTNATLTGYYKGLFAKNFARGKNYDGSWSSYEGLMQNLYVSISSIVYSGNNEVGLLLQETLPTAVHLENVIVEYDVEDATQSKIEEGNQFCMFGTSKFSLANSTKVFKNCYSISTAPVLQRKAMPAFAENQVEFTLNDKGTSVTAVGNVLDEQVNEVLTRCEKTLTVDYVMVGLKAYDDYTAMKAANNDYSSFSSDYWTIVDGVPMWTTAM